MALGYKAPAEYLLQTSPSPVVRGKIPPKSNAAYGPPIPSASPNRQLISPAEELLGGWTPTKHDTKPINYNGI